jgi:hypothetical protein
MMMFLEWAMLGTSQQSHFLLLFLHLQSKSDAILDAELFVDVMQMDLDGPLDKVKRISDLSVRKTSRNEFHNLPLALAQFGLHVICPLIALSYFFAF